jgi:hypothetical protein
MGATPVTDNPDMRRFGVTSSGLPLASLWTLPMVAACVGRL